MHLLIAGIDGVGMVIKKKFDTCFLDVLGTPVRKVSPMGHFSGKIHGYAADTEIRIGIIGDYGNLGRGVTFTGAKGGAYTGVTTSDYE
jgi:hypothetical protein